MFSQERNDIISRFREKKRRRVWKKKIRYHCRKNLADRRVRVKGRFVRASDDASAAENHSESLTTSGSALDDEDDHFEEDELEEDETNNTTYNNTDKEAVPPTHKRLRSTDLTEKSVTFKSEDDTEEQTPNPVNTELYDESQVSIPAGKRMRRHSIAY